MANKERELELEEKERERERDRQTETERQRRCTVQRQGRKANRIGVCQCRVFYGYIAHWFTPKSGLSALPGPLKRGLHACMPTLLCTGCSVSRAQAMRQLIMSAFASCTGPAPCESSVRLDPESSTAVGWFAGFV